MPTDSPSLWLDSQRRSRARRHEAARARRRRWNVRTGAGVFAASLTLATGGALAAQGTTGGATAAPAPAPAPVKVSTRAIQHALGIHADGVMGPQTRRALKHFQRAHGIKADGVAGPATLAALGLNGAQANGSLQSAPSEDAATVLAKIAQCESGGNLTAVSANGRYFGKYQFSQATWEALGGTGSPADADESTQDLFAARLYADRGTAPWPACAATL